MDQKPVAWLIDITEQGGKDLARLGVGDQVLEFIHPDELVVLAEVAHHASIQLQLARSRRVTGAAHRMNEEIRQHGRTPHAS